MRGSEGDELCCELVTQTTDEAEEKIDNNLTPTPTPSPSPSPAQSPTSTTTKSTNMITATETTATTTFRTKQLQCNQTKLNCRHDKLSEDQLDKLSSLIKIIRNGNYQEFSYLLEEERADFKTRNNLLNMFVDGQTALHYTLIYGRSLAWCKQLVLNGANPNLTNRAGWHPIHLAAFNGSKETMRYLIDCISN